MGVDFRDRPEPVGTGRAYLEGHLALDIGLSSHLLASR